MKSRIKGLWRVFTSSRLVRDESGAVATEYVILLGLLAIGLITTVTALGTSLSGDFSAANTRISNLVTSGS